MCRIASRQKCCRFRPSFWKVCTSPSARSADRALGLVHTFQKEGRNLQHFCREAIRHMRNLLVARTCGADSDLIAATPDQRPALAKAAALFSEEDLTRFFQILLQTDDDLRRKPDPRVHLEMGLLRLINAARLAPLEELLAEMKSGAPGSVSNAGMAKGASPAIASTTFTKSVAPSVVNAVSTPPKPETKMHFSSSFAANASAPSTVGTPVEAKQVLPADDSAISPKTNGASVQPIAISSDHFPEIKAAVQAQQKVLGELVDNSSRWEL